MGLATVQSRDRLGTNRISYTDTTEKGGGGDLSIFASPCIQGDDVISSELAECSVQERNQVQGISRVIGKREKLGKVTRVDTQNRLISSKCEGERERGSRILARASFAQIRRSCAQLVRIS